LTDGYIFCIWFVEHDGDVATESMLEVITGITSEHYLCNCVYMYIWCWPA